MGTCVAGLRSCKHVQQPGECTAQSSSMCQHLAAVLCSLQRWLMLTCASYVWKNAHLSIRGPPMTSFLGLMLRTSRP
jgi:hypothetical protein